LSLEPLVLLAACAAFIPYERRRTSMPARASFIVARLESQQLTIRCRPKLLKILLASMPIFRTFNSAN